MILTQLPPAGVEQSSDWPYTLQTAPRRAYSSGRWFLAMNASGHCIVWNRRTSEGIPSGYIDFYQTKTKQDALRFLTTFCSAGYPHIDAAAQDPDTKYQSFRSYRFNWVSGTVVQIAVASQVARAMFSDSENHWNEAWDIGRNFENAIERAISTGQAQ